MPAMSKEYIAEWRKRHATQTKVLNRKHAAKAYEWKRISRIFLRILL